MRSYLCLLCLAVCTALAGSVELVEGKYPRYFDYQDEKGNIHKVDLLEPVNHEVLARFERDPANNEYYLFTRRNPTRNQRLIINDAHSITSSYFNPQHQTIVLAHGWLSNQNSDVNAVIRYAYLNKEDANVIIIDWKKIAISPYTTAVRGVPAVGRELGKFLYFLHKVTGAPFNMMHLIGFSLGGHLVGNAGRELGGRVARITGLDPAGPLWGNNKDRLRHSDGVYVEAIHTDGGITGLGIGAPVADADFFPNGGRSQPGCELSVCSHNKAWKFFASTVTHDHLVARQCANMQQVINDRCTGATLRMGNSYLNKRGSGLFRVNTARRYPF